MVCISITSHHQPVLIDNQETEVLLWKKNHILIITKLSIPLILALIFLKFTPLVLFENILTILPSNCRSWRNTHADSATSLSAPHTAFADTTVWNTRACARSTPAREYTPFYFLLIAYTRLFFFFVPLTLLTHILCTSTKHTS